jgi:hypothetical protein
MGIEGAFEFADAVPGKTYEFAVKSAADALTLHFYYESTSRSNLLMRLKVAEPNSKLTELLEFSDDQTNLTIVRDKELVGNAEARPKEPLLENDSMTINGAELCSKGSTPIINATIGVEVFDAGTDKRSNVSQSISTFADIPFIGGIDLYIPATTPPQDTISIVLNGRQNGGLTQTINIPNWNSITNKVTVQFNAF